MKVSTWGSSFCDLLEGTQDKKAETSGFYLVPMLVQIINQPKSVKAFLCPFVFIIPICTYMPI